jgi:hypothetical protein
MGWAMANHLDHFSLSLFDGQGAKFCSIFGQRADLTGDRAFEISDISIQTFGEGGTHSPPLFIISDRARVNPMENSASGDGFIAISNGEFSATGEKWELSGEKKFFILNENVQVFFEKPPCEGE